MTETKIIPWSSPILTPVEFNEREPELAITLAHGLKKSESEMIIKAIKSDIPQMAAEYVWKKAMNRLIRFLGTFGSQFIGEMLDRPDITDGIELDNAITHSDAISLAAELGLINEEGQIRLRQNLELIRYFDNNESDVSYKKRDIHDIIANSIEFILQQQDSAPNALNFKDFREKLLGESLDSESKDTVNLIQSPYFFQRTAVKVLLNGVKSLAGAKRQHVLVNSHLIIPMVWANLSEEDRYSIGRAYAELSSAGDGEAVKTLKMTLSKVRGFDYVPENVRSNTFKAAAQAVIAAHNSFSNYHLEHAPIKELAKLGTAIPKPALAECMRAYLCVYIGNQYGTSWQAAPEAEKELMKIPSENWMYYISKILSKDKEVLWELRSQKPSDRFIELYNKLSISGIDDIPKTDPIVPLASAIVENNSAKVQKYAKMLHEKLMA